jgi:hypothetical protein
MKIVFCSNGEMKRKVNVEKMKIVFCKRGEMKSKRGKMKIVFSVNVEK